MVPMAGSVHVRVEELLGLLIVEFEVAGLGSSHWFISVCGENCTSVCSCGGHWGNVGLVTGDHSVGYWWWGIGLMVGDYGVGHWWDIGLGGSHSWSADNSFLDLIGDNRSDI